MKPALRFGLFLFLNIALASASFAQSVLISEIADPRLNYQSDRFIEIYNAGPSAVDLSGWSIVAVGNGADIFTWSLSGLIQPGDALVAGDQTLTVPFPVDFAAESWSTSNGTWNGKVGDGAKLIDGSSTIVDYVVVDGTRFENADYVRDGSVTIPNTTYNPTEWTATAIDYPTQASPGTHNAGIPLPVIAAIQTTPVAPAAGQTVSVSADITDATATITSAEVRWGTISNSLSNVIAMSLTSGSTWTTNHPIPALTAGTTVYFEIEAFNDVPASTVSALQTYSLAQVLSIYDIQGQGASSPMVGTTVRTQGVVTGVYGNTYVIQDGSGAWNGLWIDGTSVPAIGDLLDVQGVVTESFGAGFTSTTLLENAQVFSSTPGALPAPAVVTTGTASGEAWEGVLVQIVDADCTSPDLGGGVWQIDDGSGPLRVGELGHDSNPVLGTRYDVSGPIRHNSNAILVEPRTSADVVWAGDSSAPLLLSVAAEGSGAVRVVFTEALYPVTAQSAGNYTISGTNVLSATLDVVNPAAVVLSTTSMATGSHTLTVTGVQDLYGNSISSAVQTFDVNLYSPPLGYYASADGLTGTPLRAALHSIITNHSPVSYSATLTVFETSDNKPNGKVWDMYSDIPGATPPYEYTFGVDNGSSASAEGEGYNREHSWPRSWFGGAVSPMNSDLFQLYPTDIYVNSNRGSYPYGEVTAPDFVSLNGSKRGPNTYPGYAGIVFEPIDAYKGDFARSYFYMTVRYYTEDAGWPGSPMTNGADLEPWAQTMLYGWHQLDPVSDKERERNQVVFGYQGNRNPFIDRPDFAAAMFNISTAVEDQRPVLLQLRPSFPNPFQISTSIRFEIGRTAEVKVEVFDLRGRRVRTLVSGLETAGSHQVSWNGADSSNRQVPSGIYFLRFSSDGRSQSSKVIMLR